MAVTVVAESKLADPSPEKLLVGDDCSVRERNSCYKGKVAAIGEQSYMYTHVPVPVNITRVHVGMVTNSKYIYDLSAHDHIGTEVEMKAIETRFQLGEWTPFSTEKGILWTVSRLNVHIYLYNLHGRNRSASSTYTGLSQLPTLLHFCRCRECEQE